MPYIYKSSTPLGDILLSSDGESLTGLWFQGQKHFASTLDGETIEKPLKIFFQTEDWLKDYFAGEKMDSYPKVNPSGTPYRKEIWKILLSIPYGETVSYKYIAEKYNEKTGKITSPRAVGGAVGKNPISVIIPCHRVIGTGGKLTGYAGGTDKKQKLLDIEKNIDEMGLL